MNIHSGLQAYIAFAIVNRNNIATFGAPMFLFLAFKKLFHALLLYFPQILNHAHTITSSVTVIQTVKVFTGHTVTFMTGFDFVSPQFSAASLKDTVFVSGKTARTMRHLALFLRDSPRIG
jgi:hypothetical protein